MKINRKSAVNKLKINLTSALELPEEIMLNLPLITFTGRTNMSIENYKNIVEYSQKRIRISTTDGVITIDGINLSLKELTKNLIVIDGKISNLEFV